MTDPIDTQDEEAQARAKKKGDSGEGDSDSFGRGKAGAGAAYQGAAIDAEDEDGRGKKKKGDSGEGDSDSFGRGKAGAGAGGGIRLPPQKLQEVMSNWRHLDVNAVVHAVAEFFTEVPMRASANLSVVWDKTKANAKSFAIVNWVIEFGDKTVRELAKTRERSRARGAGRDSRGFSRQQPKTRPGMGMNMGPTGPTGQN